MKTITLKEDIYLNRESNNGKSPLDSNWDELPYYEAKAGTKVQYKQIRFLKFTVHKIQLNVDGITYSAEKQVPNKG